MLLEKYLVISGSDEFFFLENSIMLEKFRNWNKFQKKFLNVIVM